MARRRSKRRPGKGRKAAASQARREVPAAASTFQAGSLLPLAGILAFTLLVFSPAHDNLFTNWDDPDYVTENPLLPGVDLGEIFSTPVAGNFHPFTILSLAIDYQIGALDPGVYHTHNILLHLLNTGLVFYLISLLSPGKRGVALFVALFFAIHPLHVESVAWISQRKDVLFTAWYLGSLIAYLRYKEDQNLLFLGCSLLFFVISALSKPAAVPLPLVLVLIDLYRHQGGLSKEALDRKVVLEKIPFFAVALIVGLATWQTQSGAEAIASELDLGQKFLVGCYGFVAYIAKLFVPYQLSSFYAYPDVSKGLPAIFYLCPFLAAGALGAIIPSLKKDRTYAFGMLFYFFNIALVLQFVSVGQVIMSERYTYVPYIGLLFVLGHYGNLFYEANKSLRFWVGGTALLVALAFGYVSHERSKVWHDSERLWTDVISKSPEASTAYFNRGVHYDEDADPLRPDLARRDYDKTIELRPNHHRALYNKGISVRNEGSARKAQGNNREAKVLFDQALVLFDRAIASDRRVDAFVNRGNTHTDLYVMFGRTQRIQKAIDDYAEAIELDPNSELAYLNLGVAYFRKNDYLSAVTHYDRVLSINPNNAPALMNRSAAYDRLGKRQQALRDAMRAGELGYPVNQAYLNQLRR